jgi:pyruvate,orthophosphate dikinase
MVRLGLPVPPGFTVTTKAARHRRATGALPPGLLAEVGAHLREMETRVGKRFGDRFDPLLVSVRPDPVTAAAGSTSTILDVGLTDATVQGLAARTGDERFAWDSYRRLIQLFANAVYGVPGAEFDRLLDDAMRAGRVTGDGPQDAAGLRGLVMAYKRIFRARAGHDFPQAPHEQLHLAIRSAIESGDAAVTVVAMVFGNLGPGSGTGLAFGRDPATGISVYGEYLPNAQGDDLVRRVRETVPLRRLAELDRHSYDQLLAILARLTTRDGAPCSVEFTIERGTLWILRARHGARTAH